MILRGLVVFLACLNLGVGLWWLMHREPVVAPPPAIESGTGTLVLLGEAEAPPPPDLADVGAVPVPMPATAACLTLGPFATPAELRAAMNALTPLVARIQFREVASTALHGYRVYLPAAGSREEALATARQLAARRRTRCRSACSAIWATPRSAATNSWRSACSRSWNRARRKVRNGGSTSRLNRTSTGARRCRVPTACRRRPSTAADGAGR